MKLALGSAQFGMTYGIANSGSQTRPQEVREILQEAAKGGIDLIDTAAAYGNSEAVLGSALSEVAHPFRVVTKIAPMRKSSFDEVDGKRLRRVFSDSLKRLSLSKIYAVLIHSADDMLAPGADHLFQELTILKDEGLVTKIGLSAYSPQQAEFVLRRYPLDVVQLPVNLLDQRAVASGYLKRLKTLGIEIHARSAFLQGLFFIPPATLPTFFDAAKIALDRLQMEARHHDVSVQSLALAYLRSIEEIDYVIIGVDTAAQLRENLIASAWDGWQSIDFSRFACTEERIVDPSQWQTI